MNKRASCYSIDEYAMAVLMNGRPFVEKFSLGRWVGFRWGKCEISVRTEAPEPDWLWRTRFITPTGAWDLAPGWDMEILRNVSAVLDQKIETRERRLIGGLTTAQKFYGRLIADYFDYIPI